MSSRALLHRGGVPQVVDPPRGHPQLLARVLGRLPLVRRCNVTGALPGEQSTQPEVRPALLAFSRASRARALSGTPRVSRLSSATGIQSVISPIRATAL